MNTKDITHEKNCSRNWQVTYSEQGETKVIKNLSHREACNIAQSLQDEGWKNVDFKRG